MLQAGALCTGRGGCTGGAQVASKPYKPCACWTQVRSALGAEAVKEVRSLLLQRDFFLFTAERLATSPASRPAPVLALA